MRIALSQVFTCDFATKSSEIVQYCGTFLGELLKCVPLIISWLTLFFLKIKHRDAHLKGALKFEKDSSALKHSFCECCMIVSLSGSFRKKKPLCFGCAKLKNPRYYLDLGELPVWFLDGVPQFHVPLEISILTLAEKMLIQRVSLFVPLQNVKNGIMGLHGHVCAFDQNIEGFLKEVVNKSRIVSALKWLAKYNKCDRSIANHRHRHRRSTQKGRAERESALASVPLTFVFTFATPIGSFDCKTLPSPLPLNEEGRRGIGRCGSLRGRNVKGRGCFCSCIVCHYYW